MKRFIDGPGTGKTRELVKAAFEALEQGENSTLVCCDIEEMKQRIYAMGYDWKKVGIISFRDYLLYPENDKMYFIVDIEKWLRYSTETLIGGYTLTLD